MTIKPPKRYDPAEEEIVWMDLEDAFLAMQESGQALDEAWEKYRDGNAAATISDDAPLKLEEAICLQELGGFLTMNREFSTPSPSLSVKSLRNAIAKGDLPTVRPNAKNLYVTRKDIREWLDKCRGEEKKPTSFSSTPARTSGQAKSHTAQPGSSRTETLRLALDAARLSMKKRS